MSIEPVAIAGILSVLLAAVDLGLNRSPNVHRPISVRPEPLRRSARVLEAILARYLGPNVLSWRASLGCLFLCVLAAVLIVLVGALATAQSVLAMGYFIGHYYGLSIVLIGSTATLMQRWLIRRMAASKRYLPPILLFSAVLLIAILAWMIVLHWGSWLEWPQRRSPLVWGSAWYYAEMYWYYRADPQGLLVLLASLAATASLALAGLLLVAALLCRTALAAGKWLLHKTPRGLASGVLIAVWIIIFIRN